MENHLPAVTAMKTAKPTGFWNQLIKPSGLLCVLALLLAACSDPVSPFRSQAAETAPVLSSPALPPAEAPQSGEPFTVEIIIGNGNPARSVAGPDSYRIQGDIRNFYQLIVLDEEKNVVFYEDKRMENSADTELLLKIGEIAYDKTYHFLLLMGHWEWETGAGTNLYQYYDGTDPERRPFKAPTLLAAGFKTKTIDGDGSVPITLWPIVVDTEFKKDDSVTRAPVVRVGVPEPAALSLGNWKVNWTIRRGSGGNGLASLQAAQAAAGTEGLAPPQFILNETPSGDPLSISRGDTNENKDNIITASLGSFVWDDIAKGGAVNFNLAYRPFGLDPASLIPATSVSVFRGKSEVPRWIIRNGINDEAQNDKTDFITFRRVRPDGALVDPGSNGNGSVRYTVSPEPSNDLKVEDGVFKSLPSGGNAKIEFTTVVPSNMENVQVRYAVTVKSWYGKASPPYSAYTQNIDTVTPGRSSYDIIVSSIPGDCDVWVLLYEPASGKVSYPHKIVYQGVTISYGNTRYVAWNGNDETGTGEAHYPYKTVSHALEVLAAEKTTATTPGNTDTNFDWLRAQGGFCTIIIKGTGKVTEEGGAININNDHPPILLTADWYEPGTLQLASPGSLITVGAGGDLTLGGALRLVGKKDNTASLVNVQGKLFLTDGVAISGNTTGSAGAGVYVGGSGDFTMSGGTISGNTAGEYGSGGSGGGVTAEGSGARFTMSDGTISGNTAGEYGGGVYAYNGATFTMSGGAISGNTSDYGGGVTAEGSGARFTMSGGTISGNTGRNHGGGVLALYSGTFTMSGGTISGNTANGAGGGVWVKDATFTKAGGGIIYGSDVDPPLKNTASKGFAVAYEIPGEGVRNKTVWAADTISTSDLSIGGGWE